MATKTLAEWATKLTPSSIPSSVRNAARRSLYNYIGCAIAGSSHPAVSKAHAALSPFFGAPTSTLLGGEGNAKADPQHAALLNGIASHVHDYDDTHLATIIHPTGPVASAVLAYAEYKGGVSGADLLCASTAGIEASCKLGLAVWPSHYEIGWHITSSTGSVGAAVGVGKLMGLTAEQMAHAIGSASVQVVGLREMFGSDTKAFHPGRAAQSGLLAALLAQKGYTSSPQALEAKRGWANVVVGSETARPQLDEFFGELGQKWEIESNAFKPFPCGIVCHPAIDACILLHHEMEKQGLYVGDVKEVRAEVHPLVIELTSKREPMNGLEGKFSVFHGAAVGLIYGKAGVAEYADAVVTSPEVVHVRDKIVATPSQQLKPDEAHISVQFRNGSKIEKHIHHAIGSLEVPMTDEQLSQKFVDQCEALLGQQGAKKASEAAWNIGEARDVAQVISTLWMTQRRWDRSRLTDERLLESIRIEESHVNQAHHHESRYEDRRKDVHEACELLSPTIGDGARLRTRGFPSTLEVGSVRQQQGSFAGIVIRTRRRPCENHRRRDGLDNVVDGGDGAHCVGQLMEMRSSWPKRRMWTLGEQVVEADDGRKY